MDKRTNPRLGPLVIKAQIDASLKVRLLEVEAGATLWTGAARDSQNVAHLSLLSRGPAMFTADFDFVPNLPVESHRWGLLDAQAEVGESPQLTGLLIDVKLWRMAGFRRGRKVNSNTYRASFSNHVH